MEEWPSSAKSDPNKKNNNHIRHATKLLEPLQLGEEELRGTTYSTPVITTSSIPSAIHTELLMLSSIFVMFSISRQQLVDDSRHFQFFVCHAEI